MHRVAGRARQPTPKPAEPLLSSTNGVELKAAERLELDGCVLVLSICNHLLLVGLVDELDVALHNNAFAGKLDLSAFHLQRLAANERWRAIWDECLHGVAELVSIVKLYRWWHTCALPGQNNARILGDNIGVGAKRNKIVTLLDRRESRARDAEGNGTFEGGDGSTHGGLQLDDLGGAFVAWVDCLVIQHHRQGNRATISIEDILQFLQIDPQVVRVEILVPASVLKGCLIILRALRRLAQCETSALLFLRQMSTFLISVRSVGDLHHERR